MYEEYLIKILNEIDTKGYLKSRESTTLEYKENFSFQNLAKYLKTIAAFANTQGGYILFGVADSPRIPIGIKKEKFEEIKIETVSTYLSEYFSPEIHWDINMVEVNNKWFGFIYITCAEDKPIICKKNSGKILKDGEIYYRYRGKSRTIEFPELKKIHIEIKEKEKKLWMSHIEKIAKIGPKNVAFIDLLEGQIDSPNFRSQFLIDEKLLKDLKTKVSFIKEGEFVEKEGTPTLRLVGDLQTSDQIIVPNLDPNKDYPFLSKHLAHELQIRPYDAQILIWKFDFKSNKRFCIEVDAGKSKVYKYSKIALKKLREILEEHSSNKNYLKNISDEYVKRNKA